MNLENAMSEVAKIGIGPVRTYTFDEWIGGVERFECPNCNAQEVSNKWHFCPNCGRGLRPIPCDHFMTDMSKLEPEEPIIDVSDDGASVKCTKCDRSTKSFGKVRSALMAWNYGEEDI